MLSYEEQACALIEQAYQAKHANATITSAGRRIVVDLKNFTQFVEGEQPGAAPESPSSSAWLQLIADPETRGCAPASVAIGAVVSTVV